MVENLINNNQKPGKMSKIFVLLCVSFFIISKLCNSQGVEDGNIVEIAFCEEMMQKKENSLIKLSYVYENDTFFLPEMQRNKYHFPFTAKDTVGKKRIVVPIPHSEGGQRVYDEVEWIYIIVENCKYEYAIPISIRSLLHPKLRLCVVGRGGRYRRNLFEVYSVNYHGAHAVSYIPRIKK